MMVTTTKVSDEVPLYKIKLLKIQRQVVYALGQSTLCGRVLSGEDRGGDHRSGDGPNRRCDPEHV
jgi:hypothetical protein